MRITNNSIVRNYTRNLNSGLSQLNKYSNMVTTQRRFSSMSENTSLGVRAMEIRRALDNIASYKDTAETVSSQFTSAEGQMMQIVSLGQDIASRYTIGLNGTNDPADRKIMAEEIEKFRDQILACANGQFVDRYMFGGSNVKERPFTTGLDANGKETLFYNGIDVAQMADQNGNMKPEYQYLLDDAVFVDIGLGLKMDGNNIVVETSAFKSSLNGLDFMGIGDENIYLICNEIIDALRDETFTNNAQTAALLDKITAAYNNVAIQVTSLGADQQYLDYTIDRMATDTINLYTRQDAIEFIDPAEAIMQWKMQEYVYNASLQMGQRLLQPTLFNFIS